MAVCALELIDTARITLVKRRDIHHKDEGIHRLEVRCPNARTENVPCIKLIKPPQAIMLVVLEFAFRSRGKPLQIGAGR